MGICRRQRLKNFPDGLLCVLIRFPVDVDTLLGEMAPGTGPCLQRSCLFPRVQALPWLLVLLKLLQSPLSPVWMRSWRSQVEQARQEP